jgi:hypothetical protein
MKVKKLVFWSVSAFVSLILTFVLWFCITSYCDGLSTSRYSPFCFICIPSNIRNVPLIGLVGEPEYSTVTYAFDWEPKYSHPGNNEIDYKSNESPTEIVKELEDYFASKDFKLVGRTNTLKNGKEGLTIAFDGKNSSIEIVVRPNEKLNNETGKNIVNVNEIPKWDE